MSDTARKILYGEITLYQWLEQIFGSDVAAALAPLIEQKQREHEHYILYGDPDAPRPTGFLKF